MRASETRATLAWVALLCGVVVAFYARTLDYPFLILDDVRFIKENPLITAPWSAAWVDLALTPNEGYVIPVTVLFRALLHALGGGAPSAFHAASIALHAAVVVLLFFLTKRLSRHVHVSGVTALLFSVHPIVAEPVAWVSGSKDLLMTLFALAATIFFLRGVDQPDARRRTRSLSVALFLACLAHLSKPTSTLVGASWLIYLWARAREGHAKSPRLAIAVAVTNLVAGFMLGWLGRSGFVQMGILEELAKPLADLRVLTVLGHQLQHLFWPDNLHPLYLIYPTAGFDDPHTALGLGAVLVAVVSAWFLRHRPNALLALALAAAFYAPVSSIIPFPRLICDSYVYAPFAALVALGAIGARSIAERARMRPVIGGLSTLVLCLPLGLTTWGQVDRWSSERSLWAPLVLSEPNWHVPPGNLATALLVERKSAEARYWFKRSFSFGYNRDYLIDYGVSLAEERRLDDAECVLVEAAYHARETIAGVYNLAVHWGGNAGRPPAYPEVARALIPVAQLEMAAGRMKSTPSLLRGLELQRERLGAPGQLPSWPKGTCRLTPFPTPRKP